MLSLGLKNENPDIQVDWVFQEFVSKFDGLFALCSAQNLGILAFLIPIFALGYGVRQIYKLPPEYFVGEANQRLLA